MTDAAVWAWASDAASILGGGVLVTSIPALLVRYYVGVVRRVAS